MTVTKAVPLSSACCDPVLGPNLDRDAATLLADSLKVLAEPARLRILNLLGGDEHCVCDLMEPLGLSQPTVSHHLKVLTEAGFIERDQRGKWAYYRVRPGSLEPIRRALATQASATSSSMSSSK